MKKWGGECRRHGGLSHRRPSGEAEPGLESINCFRSVPRLGNYNNAGDRPGPNLSDGDRHRLDQNRFLQVSSGLAEINKTRQSQSVRPEAPGLDLGSEHMRTEDVNLMVNWVWAAVTVIPRLAEETVLVTPGGPVSQPAQPRQTSPVVPWPREGRHVPGTSSVRHTGTSSQDRRPTPVNNIDTFLNLHKWSLNWMSIFK